MKIIDISVAVDDKLPLWPNAITPQCTKHLSLDQGHVCNDSSIHFGLHAGTHIDAPLHFVSGGKSIDKMPLEIFVGPVFVAHLPKVKEISAVDLDKLKIPKHITRILFKTSNSVLWSKGSVFTKNYVGLTADAAQWLTKRKFILVGVDYLSIAKFDEAVAVHKILLGKEVALLEGINLSKVKPGMYQLMCFPIKIGGQEAAPVRAILTK